MRALIPKTLILHLSSRSPGRLPLQFSTVAGEESQQRRQFEPQSHQPFSTQRRNYDDENRSVKVTVWWDFENCQVPVGVHVERVANRISSALRSTGIKGPITITAFGDVSQMSRATQEALTSTGVCLNHVPHRGKNSSDRSFMADLVYWVTQNPPPAHFFLISSDKDFANILHRLRMSNYNIILAGNDLATGVLCSAATIMWPWAELVKGEHVSAKHFNHPPDGFYGSWYGQYKGVLDDPFLICEQCAVSQPEESMESIAEAKIRPVPRVVVNGIRNVLNSYPEGLSLSELRCELRRKNIALDKHLYGHKNFSSLLASMPSIVKFRPNSLGNGQLLVVDKRSVEEAEVSLKPSTESKSSKEAQSIDVTEKNRNLTLEEKPSLSVPLDTIVGTGEPTPMPVHVPSQTPLQASDTVVGGGAITTEKEQDAEVNEGLLIRIWTTLTGRKDDFMPKVDSTSSEESVEGNDLKKLKSEEKASLSKDTSPCTPRPSFSDALGTNKSSPDEKTTKESEKSSETYNPKIGFFSQLANWWQTLMYGAKDEGVISAEDDANGESVTKITCHPETHPLFSRSQFWDAVESFLLTSKGADLISKSNTREQLVHKLKKDGPCVLKDLEESHMITLVELLISEKSWIEESASHPFPFRLSLTSKRSFMSNNVQGSNGLSSLFSGKTSQSSLSNGTLETKPQNLAELKSWFQRTCTDTKDIKPEEFQKLFESNFCEKLICSTYGYPTIRSLLFACSAGQMPPTKEEILSDCHKLLTELLKENPNGVNMSNFRPAFFQKYGYILDCRMLGYSKLASLLQIMPGVKIESSYILPAKIFSSASNSEDWEELGPVSDTQASTDNKNVSSYSRASLSDEEFTDSEDENPSDFDGSKRQAKRGEEDSSLMNILDSWYSSKDDASSDGLVDCSRNNPQNASDSNSRVRPYKHYSFVAESKDEEKDRLVDNILGSLKKAGKV